MDLMSDFAALICVWLRPFPADCDVLFLADDGDATEASNNLFCCDGEYWKKDGIRFTCSFVYFPLLITDIALVTCSSGFPGTLALGFAGVAGGAVAPPCLA